MEQKKYEWEDNKFSRRTKSLGITYFVSGLIFFLGWGLVSIWLEHTAILFLPLIGSSFVLAVVFMLISAKTSDKDKYSREFLCNIKERSKNAKTQNELLDLKKYILYQATDKNGIIRLSYPTKIQQELTNINKQFQEYETLIAFCKFNKVALRLTTVESAVNLIDNFFATQKKIEKIIKKETNLHENTNR
jgi:hypothetical protein